MSSDLNTVDIDHIESRLMSLGRGDGQEVASQLYNFGTMMVNQILHRAAQLDLKLRVVLNWSYGLLVFLMLGGLIVENGIFIVVIASVLTFAATYFSYLGFSTREWEWPSEQDWFQESLLHDAVTLRKFHIKQLLQTYQQHIGIVKEKGRLLAATEKFLLAAVIIAVGAILANQTDGNFLIRLPSFAQIDIPSILRGVLRVSEEIWLALRQFGFS